MKGQVFIGQDSVSVKNVLNEFKRAGDFSQIQESSAVYLFREFISSPRFAASKAQLSPSSDEPIRHDGTITSYSAVLTHMLM